MENKPFDCFVCKEVVSPLFNFSCGHKMCTQCLIRIIFINHIQDFEIPGAKVIKCPCGTENGMVTLEMNHIFNLFKTKTINDTKKQKKNVCQLHDKAPKEYYCKECGVIVCKLCSEVKDNEHFEHRIEKILDYAKKIKYYLDKIQMKYKSYKDFSDNLEKIGQKFKEIIEGTYNSTLQTIDNCLQTLNLFRSEYVSNYQKKLEIGVFTLKILKLFYLNYYYDFDKATKSNDINLIKYINDINYELDDVEINHNLGINQKLSDVYKVLEEVKKSSESCLKLSFIFSKVPRNFIKLQTIEQAHKKLVTSLVQVNQEKFISGSSDYSIKYWEEKENLFSNTYTKSEFTGQIVNLTMLQDGRILSSSAKDNNIRVWKEDESGLVCDQTLTGHDSPIAVIIQLLDKRVVSGSLDKSIIIWEEQEGCFQIQQKLTKHTQGVYAIICLFDSRLSSGDGNGRILIWQERGGTYNSTEILNQKERIRTLCQLKDTRILSGGDEIIIYVWKQVDEFYQLEQKVKGHSGVVNLIILLRDGRFASASKDKSIIIWESGQKGKIKQSEQLIGHNNGVYSIIQLMDGRLCTGGADLQIIIWANRNNLQ